MKFPDNHSLLSSASRLPHIEPVDVFNGVYDGGHGSDATGAARLPGI